MKEVSMIKRNELFGEMLKEDIMEDGQDIFEMANLEYDLTGLAVYIYVSGKGNTKHGPRLKVSKIYGKMSKSLFPITISDKPKVIGDDIGDIKSKDIKKIIEWVKLNKELLLAFWNGEINIKDFVNSIQKVD
jgi:hypothetical protein